MNRNLYISGKFPHIRYTIHDLLRGYHLCVYHFEYSCFIDGQLWVKYWTDGDGTSLLDEDFWMPISDILYPLTPKKEYTYDDFNPMQP